MRGILSKKNKGADSFDVYYSQIYGDRWPELRSSLVKEKSHVAIQSPFYEKNMLINFDVDEHIPFCFQGEQFQNPSELVSSNLYPYYLMDYASVWPAYLLNPKPGMKVLDLCAAPGGKSLILGFMMNSGELVCNDKSPKRRERLKKVLSNYIPQESELNWSVRSHDAMTWGLHEKNVYDRVLLDAPCSSERHMLEVHDGLKDWSIGRTKRLGKNQVTMIASAFDALKVGGLLCYSTCSISPLENDEVIKKLLEKRSGQAIFKKVEMPIGESTEYGHIILPDQSSWGPIYLSLIEKVSSL